MKLKIVAISDSHGMHRKLRIPDGDILVHAGDLTRSGNLSELEEFNDFLGSLPHRHKIIVAGNHDFCFESDDEECARKLTNAIYLQDKAAVVEGIKFYGSPWQPWFFDWAFNLQRGEPLRKIWAKIPADTNVLITHGPPMHHGDRTINNEDVGCQDLLDAVLKIRPRFHVFGHIHEGYGTTTSPDTTFINASVCDVRYRPVNPPVVFEYEI